MSWIRTAPSKLVEANREVDERLGKYDSAVIPSVGASGREMASGGGSVVMVLFEGKLNQIN